MVSSARASIAHLHDPQSMLYPLLRPLLFALDPETAHDTVFASLDAAAACGVAKLVAPRVRSSPVEVMGLTFPNRVGLAAGLDKNAAHIDGLATMGFGFIECGTVTPRPQPGNPKPRMFRLIDAEAIINRLGFNNDGVERFLMGPERLTNGISFNVARIGGYNPDYRVGSAPLSVAIVDVSGDGKPDLVTVNGGSSSASVLLGKGDGSFGASVGYATGSTPQSVAIGDVSGDGKPDLAVANGGSNTVSVLLGNGDGSFGAKMGEGTGSVAESGPIAKANDPDPFRLEGRRVRLLAPELGPRGVTGIVAEVRGDTLRFTPDKQSTSTPVRLGALSGLEVSRGTKSHVWTGVGIGLLGGALVGGAIASSSVQPGDEYEGLVIFIGGVLGGVVGMAGGAIIGSTHTERWDSVRLPISIGLLPNTHGLGLSVELSNR